MPKLEYQSKSLDFDANNDKKTHIILTDTAESTVHIFLPGDLTDKSTAELFKLAMQRHYEDNFPRKAENEKFGQIDAQIQDNKEIAEDNKRNLETIAIITDILLSLAIATESGMDYQLYAKVAAVVKPLEAGKRYTNGDIVAMPYPFDTNPKWPKGTATILRFTMPQDDGYIYKGQKIEDMLQKGALSIVLPKLD